jgi:4-amino-4-deoxy-L-arabinose transferase-like glycosyltransferase
MPTTSHARPAGWDRGLIGALLLATMLNGMGLWWGLPLRGVHAWDVDSIAPMGPLIAAKRMIADDWWNSGYYNKYPMGHFFVLMAGYAPYVGYLWLTGGLRNPSEVYPFGFRDPETALTVLSLIARGINALMGVGIVLLVYLTMRHLAGRTAALFSGLTVALSPVFIFYAHTGNVDTPSLFWSALGLFAFGRLIAGQCELRNYLLLGAAVGMAAATKEQTLGLFLLMPLSVLVMHTQHVGAAPASLWSVIRAVVDRKLLGGLTASIATFVVATHLIFNWDGNVLRFRWRLFGIHPIYGTNYPGSGLEVDGRTDALRQIAATCWDSMNPVLLCAAVVGLVVLPLRQRWAQYFLVPFVSYLWLVVILAPMPFFRARFVMEIVLVLAFFVGPVLGALWTFATERSRAFIVALILIWTYSFLYGAEVDHLLVRDARYAAETWLATNTAAGGTVEAFSDPVYLPRFPRHVNVRFHPDLTSAALEGLKERSPDFLVLSSAYSRRLTGSENGELLAGLFDGDFGYGPVRIFRRDPLISPRLIAGLSPDIVILANHR